LQVAYSITHIVLFAVAATLWFLYFHEALFRSGRVKTHWLKKRLIDLLAVVFIAAVTFLIATVILGIHVHRGR